MYEVLKRIDFCLVALVPHISSGSIRNATNSSNDFGKLSCWTSSKYTNMCLRIAKRQSSCKLFGERIAERERKKMNKENIYFSRIFFNLVSGSQNFGLDVRGIVCKMTKRYTIIAEKCACRQRHLVIWIMLKISIQSLNLSFKF